MTTASTERSATEPERAPVLRLLSAESAKLVASVAERCFTDPWSHAVIAAALSAPQNAAIGAYRDGGLCGFLFVSAGADEGEISDLAVLPEARRGGVGSALLREGLRILRERGCDSVFLEVRESNTAARELYTAFGFLPCGVRRHYYRNPPENACLYKLSLKPEG